MFVLLGVKLISVPNLHCILYHVPHCEGGKRDKAVSQPTFFSLLALIFLVYAGKSDVFSLGKIMKFMCRDGRAPSPAPVGCSSKWRALVAQCLLMDPSDRPDPLTVFMRIQSMGGQLLAGSDN